MDRSKFLSDQRDIALDAIRRVIPDFQPVYTPPTLGYNNLLLNDLNQYTEANYLKATECKAAPNAEIMNSKKGYNQRYLQDMARTQLKIELDGSVTIQSIENTKEFGNAELCVSKEFLFLYLKMMII